MTALNSRLVKLEEKLTSPSAEGVFLLDIFDGKSDEFIFKYLLALYKAHMAFYGESAYETDIVRDDLLTDGVKDGLEASLCELATKLGYVEVSKTVSTGERLKWEKVDGLTTWTKKLPPITYTIIDFVKGAMA